MSGWWMGDLYQQGEIVVLVSWTVWVIGSIVLHELAHGWAALWQGDDTPRRLDRLTLNPLVHMGPWSLLMFALIGLAWGMMPVNPANFRDGRKGDVYVALAGPAMNVLLSLIALTAHAFWLRFSPADEPLLGNVAQFLYIGGWLNIILALFNLLPLPPLDGSRILAGLSRRAERFYSRPQAQMFGLVVLGVIFFSPLGDAVFIGINHIASVYARGLMFLLGG